MNINQPRNATLTRNFNARSRYIVGVEETRIEFPAGTRLLCSAVKNYWDEPSDYIECHIWTNPQETRGFSCMIRRDAIRLD